MGFGKGKGFTGIEYHRLYPTTLTIPVPSISNIVAEDHSGGGYTAAVNVPDTGQLKVTYTIQLTYAG